GVFSRGDPAGDSHSSAAVRRTRGSERQGMLGSQSGCTTRCLSPVTHVCETWPIAPDTPLPAAHLVLIPPKILKPSCPQFRVFHRVLNVPMPQVELDRARILVRIGQLIPTRMPELVRMHWKAQGGHLTRLGDHLAGTRIRQRSLALREKDIGGLTGEALEFP